MTVTHSTFSGYYLQTAIILHMDLQPALEGRVVVLVEDGLLSDEPQKYEIAECGS